MGFLIEELGHNNRYLNDTHSLYLDISEMFISFSKRALQSVELLILFLKNPIEQLEQNHNGFLRFSIM